MKRPYVICHMMSSVDGRILTAQWGKVKGMNNYEETGSSHKADAWMCGRITMERDFAEKTQLRLKKADHPVSREDYIANQQAKTFAIAIDAAGKLNWQKAEIDSDHIISVLTEEVTDQYLHYLRETGISYVFGGKKDINFSLVLEKLRELFSIKTLLLEGGGHLNGSFLNEGLIDELSFLHMPVADGSPDTPTLFEVTKNIKKSPASHLKLISIKQLENDIVWMRYKIK
ncbi:RibD family protein [Pedobacter sp. L105]|uniref:RibD family protein n=1 Tax=Pedobacter sp. L105 TaxID=1641871 RepID=UPI00131B69AE|nr:RibD family protein [Pedobacter sp. L105]